MEKGREIDLKVDYLSKVDPLKWKHKWK